MIRKLRYSTDAREDLRDIADFITEESGSEDVAEFFIIQLDERCRTLASLPGTLGSARPELRFSIRSTPHKGYVILFRYGDNLLEVINIVHGSRDLANFFINN